MTSNADVRKAHGLLDALASEMNVKTENVTLLRSLIPALPAQKTLEEIHEDVDVAWLEADDPELKEWLCELSTQIKGLFYSAPNSPELPAGMRMAKHEEYGRCVVSPGRNHFGQCMIFVLDSDREEGSDWHYEPSTSLTFLDTSPTAAASHHRK